MTAQEGKLGGPGACPQENVKVKVKLRFSAPSAGIAEIEQT